MVFKIQSENARKTIAILSVLISMLVFVFVNALVVGRFFELPQLIFFSDQQLFNHICLLQIFASILLFMGSSYGNQWFFLPWLLMAFVFAYMLVYKSLYVWLNLLSDVKLTLTVLFLIYITAGVWFYFIHAVYVDFQEMRNKDKLFIMK